MTIKEAIKALDLTFILGSEEMTEKQEKIAFEALNMAIDALESKSGNGKQNNENKIDFKIDLPRLYKATQKGTGKTVKGYYLRYVDKDGKQKHCICEYDRELGVVKYSEIEFDTLEYAWGKQWKNTDIIV